MHERRRPERAALYLGGFVLACLAALWVGSLAGGRKAGARAALRPEAALDLAEAPADAAFDETRARDAGAAADDEAAGEEGGEAAAGDATAAGAGGSGAPAAERGTGFGPGPGAATDPAAGAARGAAAAGAAGAGAAAANREEAATEKEPPASLSGRVTGPGGEPVEGARVRVRSGGRTYQEKPTGPDGTYLVEGVAAGRYRVSARADGLLDGSYPDAVNLAPGERRAGVDIALGAGGSIAGHVLEADGDAPIEGARVTLVRGGPFGGVTVRTGPDGAFAIEGAASGANTIRVIDDRYLPAAPLRVTVAPGDGGAPGRADGVVVRLRGGAVVEGSVLTSEGVPADAQVSLQDQRGRRLRNMRAARGAFEFPGLPARRYQVVATGGAGAATSSFDLANGERRRVDLVLEGGLAIEGTVTDPEGKPVAGVRVTATAQGFSLARAATSDTRGAFRIGGLMDGAYLVSVAPSDLYEAPPPEPANAGGPALAFTLRAGGVIEGRVRLPDGSPAGGASIGLYTPEGARSGGAEADPGGAFRVAHLPAVALDLYARGEGSVRKLPVEPVAGEVRAVDVLLRPPAVLSGRVVDSRGAPLSGAVVTAVSQNGVVRRSARTRTDGTFVLGELYQGRYDVRATRSGASAATSIDLAPEERREDLVIAVP
jgi:hypothetical protein